MKRFVAIIVLSIIIGGLLCSCSCATEPQQETVPSVTDNADIEKVMTLFQPPAVHFDLDLKKKDPSNEDVKLEYDNDGRIVKCTYTIDKYEIYQSYTYEENVVQIYSFYQNRVIETASYNYKKDKKAGFIEVGGYYLKDVKIVEEEETTATYEKITDTEGMITLADAIELVKKEVGESYSFLPQSTIKKDDSLYYVIKATEIKDGRTTGVITEYLVKVDGSKVIKNS